MAKMIPTLEDQEIIAAHDSSAELQVYRALEISLSDEYTVFYSVRWLARGRKGQHRDGETDFVVIHPDQGFLVIEVKGGSLERDAGSDRWVNTSNGARAEIESPFAQAENSKRALIGKIQSLPGWEKRRFTIGHSVFLPNIRKAQAYLGADAPAEIVGFADDIDEIDTWISSLFRLWNEGDGERYHSALSSADMQVFQDALVPDIEISPNLGASLLSDNREIRRLTVEQYSVLTTISMLPRVAVRGGAGTGKTMLAIEKARRLASEGNRTLLTCFNRSLGRNFQRLEKPEGLLATNFHDLAWRLAEEAGCDVPTRTQDKSRWGDLPQDFYDVVLPEAMLEALDRKPELKFDAIVVDEGQDFPEQWWDVLELSQSDANHPVFYVFYDDNQQIYRESTVLPDGLAPIPLTVNLRNSRPIHRLAARRYDGSDFTCVGPEGREAEMVVVSDTRSMKNEISRALHRLTQEEGVKPAEIAVLTGKSLGDSDASEAGRIGVFEVEQSDIEQDEKITFDTVRRFKGLERSTIVLCEMEKASRDLVYAALTRARSHLITIGSKEFIETLA